MNETLKFLIGVSPILLIMGVTLCVAAYKVSKISKRRRD